MALDPESLYMQLGQLVADIPDLSGTHPITPDMLKWLGRASVLVAQVSDAVDQAMLRLASDNLTGFLRESNAHQITSIVHRALAQAEARVPPGMQGSFIPAGAPFDALRAIAKVLGEAKDDVLVVDPYMDGTVLTDFAPLIREGVAIRLLSDPFSTKPETLKPASERWGKQYGDARPLEVRFTTPRVLHDRLIIVDGHDAWSVTQSLKDFAKRSPASVLRVPSEAAGLKLEAYEKIWSDSQQLA